MARLVPLDPLVHKVLKGQLVHRALLVHKDPAVLLDLQDHKVPLVYKALLGYKVPLVPPDQRVTPEIQVVPQVPLVLQEMLEPLVLLV